MGISSSAKVLVGRLFDHIPMQMIWTALIAILVWLFLKRRRFGPHIYLIGDNMERARLLGINVMQKKLLVFAVVRENCYNALGYLPGSR